MPISFSSFGDIVAVLQLAWQLRAALSEAAGASSEINALITDVDVFTRALQQVKAFIGRRSVPLESAVENGIKHALIACHDILRRVLHRVVAFKRQMTTRVGVAAWRQYMTVASWSILGGRKEVDALRLRLSEQIGVIQTYLALCQSSDQTRMQSAIDRQGTTLDRLCSAIQDIQTPFDLGAPSFHFCDRETGAYFKPLVLTSLPRLFELVKALGSRMEFTLDDVNNCLVYRKYYRFDYEPDITFKIHDTFIGDMLILAGNESEYGAQVLSISLCFFKERAFDQWQVLVGLPSETRKDLSSRGIEAFRHILQRRHAISADCNCDGGFCRKQRRLRGPTERARTQWVATICLMNQISRLYASYSCVGRSMANQELDDWTDQFTGVREELVRKPIIDSQYLTSIVIPLLKLYLECQHPRIATLERILRAAPRMTGTGWSGIWIYSCSISTQWEDGRLELRCPTVSWSLHPGETLLRLV